MPFSRWKDVGGDATGQKRQLVQLILNMTQSGQPEPDAAQVKQLTGICRRSEQHVEAAHEVILGQLRRRHAEVRLSALQLLNTLFTRSHRCRQLVVEHISELIQLCVTAELPPPAGAAAQLRRTAIRCIHAWNERYSAGYKKLALAHRQLRVQHGVNFSRLCVEEASARRAQERRDERLANMKQVKLQQLQQEVDQRKLDITNMVTQLENCFSLLLDSSDVLDAGAGPTSSSSGGAIGPFLLEGQAGTSSDAVNVPESTKSVRQDTTQEVIDGEIVSHRQGPVGDVTVAVGDPVCGEGNVKSCGDDEASDDDDPVYDEDECAVTGVFRGHGMHSARHQLEVRVPDQRQPLLAVTEANSSIVSTLRELIREVTRSQLPTVRRWLQVASKTGAGEDLLKQLMDAREVLAAAVRRYESLNLPPADDSDSDDGDLEEVPEKLDLQPTATVSSPAGPSTSGYSVVESSSGSAAKSADSTYGKLTSPNTSKSATSAEIKPVVSTSKVIPACSPTTTSSLAAAAGLPCGAATRLSSPSAKSSTSPVSSAGRSSAGPVPSTSAAGGDEGDLLAAARRSGLSVDAASWTAGPAESQYEVETVWRGSSVAERDPTSLRSDTVVEVSRSFEPVQHTCRAPLPSGRLCPRADRHKCPLHGPIIPRDLTGRPTRERDVTRLREQRARGDDWQDPGLLAELQAATGLDLRVERGRRGARRGSAQGNLTQIHRPRTARERLTKKLFTKRGAKSGGQ